MNRSKYNFNFGSRREQEPAGERVSSYTIMDKHISRIAELNKLSNSFISNSNHLQTISNLKANLEQREKEIKHIRSNFWLVHKSHVQGLSGFWCRRCNQLGFSPVRTVYYDRTEQVNHVCNEDIVKSMKWCSIRKSALKNTEVSLAAKMMEGLDFYMPGPRCIESEDVSRIFTELEGNFGLEHAKEKFGVPDRIYFCSLEIAYKKNWMEETIRKGRSITLIESDEIMELLINIKSTYGILELKHEGITKRIIFNLVPVEPMIMSCINNVLKER